MSKAVAAVLLSALVIPGAGHLYLQHKRRGWLLILIVIASVSAVAIEASRRASAIVQQIQAEGGLPSGERMLELVIQSSQQSHGSMMTVASLLLLASWLFGVIDAGRLGRRQTASNTAQQ